MTEERTSLLQRFRAWRALRKRERYERKARARENLKNYKPPTHGAPGPEPARCLAQSVARQRLELGDWHSSSARTSPNRAHAIAAVTAPAA